MELPPTETLTTPLIAGHPTGLAFGVGGDLTLAIIAFRYFYLERITREKLVLFHVLALTAAGIIARMTPRESGLRSIHCEQYPRSFHGRFQWYGPTFATRPCAVVVFNHQVQD